MSHYMFVILPNFQENPLKTFENQVFLLPFCRNICYFLHGKTYITTGGTYEVEFFKEIVQ